MASWHLRQTGTEREPLCGTRRVLSSGGSRPVLVLSDESARRSAQALFCRRCVRIATQRAGSVDAYLGRTV